MTENSCVPLFNVQSLEVDVNRLVHREGTEGRL